MSIAYKVVKDFEREIAKFAGAKYGVAVESCTNAILLSLIYDKQNSLITRYDKPIATFPKYTYPGVVMSAMVAGYKVKFKNLCWKSIYCIDGTNIIDSALRFRKGMYIPGTLYCLSFHYKKHLPIGRGGMILTDNKKAYNWLKMARFDGRKEKPLSEDNATIIGYNMYMTPEQAARGLALFEAIKHKNLSDLKVSEQGYPDLTKWSVFK